MKLNIKYEIFLLNPFYYYAISCFALICFRILHFLKFQLITNILTCFVLFFSAFGVGLSFLIFYKKNSLKKWLKMTYKSGLVFSFPFATTLAWAQANKLIYLIMKMKPNNFPISMTLLTSIFFVNSWLYIIAIMLGIVMIGYFIINFLAFRKELVPTNEMIYLFGFTMGCATLASCFTVIGGLFFSIFLHHPSIPKEIIYFADYLPCIDEKICGNQLNKKSFIFLEHNYVSIAYKDRKNLFFYTQKIKDENDM